MLLHWPDFGKQCLESCVFFPVPVAPVVGSSFLVGSLGLVDRLASKLVDRLELEPSS